MSIDWQLARAQTPGCENVVHFNNAGAALMPECVLRAGIDHWIHEAQWGGYEAAEQSAALIEHAYAAAAALLGCRPAELAIVDSASRAWDFACSAVKFAPGDVILTTPFEYANNYMTMLQARKRSGVEIVVIPRGDSGEVSLKGLRGDVDRWGPRIRVISITHVPTNNGLVNPVAEVGDVIRSARSQGQLSRRSLYFVDACQSAGQIAIDVDAVGCDVLTTCSRKFLRGPRGLGILFVRSGSLDIDNDAEPLLVDVRGAEWTSRNRYTVHSDGRRFETWEANNAAKIALGVAIDHVSQWGIDWIEEYVSALAATLRTRLRSVPGVRVHDDGDRQCGIVSFTVNGCDPQEVRTDLGRRGINVGVSERALTRLDMEERGLESLVRASVHYYNSEDEVQLFTEAIDELRNA
jgi:selenocysteine lyase/cysteine desulfurase